MEEVSPPTGLLSLASALKTSAVLASDRLSVMHNMASAHTGALATVNMYHSIGSCVLLHFVAFVLGGPPERWGGSTI